MTPTTTERQGEAVKVLHDIIERLHSPDVDPQAVAEQVYDELTAEERDAVLRNVLPQLVADHYRSMRLSLQRNFRIDQPRSTKASRVADWYQAWLAQPVFVSTGWKRLQDCTLDDVLFLAEDRHRRADELRNEANRWDATAKVMKDTEARTVADVPQDQLRDVLS